MKPQLYVRDPDHARRMGLADPYREATLDELNQALLAEPVRPTYGMLTLPAPTPDQRATIAAVRGAPLDVVRAIRRILGCDLGTAWRVYQRDFAEGSET